jgi:ribosomal-protein-alanine N-acetyltransferase
MSALPQTKLEFGPMREADVDAVTAIEQRAHAFPWTRGNFVNSLKAGHSAWVLRDGGAIVGYGLLLMTVDEAELLDITIAPECQRRGLGGMLMAQLFDVARGHGAVRMFLEVRAGNAAAQALYRRAGFSRIGLRRAYYHGKEDAIVMAREL